MRILILSSRLPYPPHRGDKLRLFNIIKKLSSSGHRLSLISFIEQKNEHTYVDQLRPYCEQIFVEYLPAYRSWLKATPGIFSKKPLQVAYYSSRRMGRIVNSFMQQNKIDLIFVHLFRMAQYVEKVRDIYKILDMTDVVSQHLERSIKFRSWPGKQIYSSEWLRIKEYEKRITMRFDECWVISNREAEALLNISPLSKVKIIPNGVDVELFKPQQQDKDDRLSFVGYLSSAYNVDAILFFYEEILPQVKKSIPTVKFYVAGNRPHHKITKLARDGDMVITGFVDDLCGFLNKSKIFVAPFRFASGIQNKILEAMSTGLPVVTTSVANEGLGAVPDEEILIADTPKEFSAQIVHLLRDDRRREEIGLKARGFVKKKFNWDRVAERVKEVEQGTFSEKNLGQRSNIE